MDNTQHETAVEALVESGKAKNPNFDWTTILQVILSMVGACFPKPTAAGLKAMAKRRPVLTHARLRINLQLHGMSVQESQQAALAVFELADDAPAAQLNALIAVS